LTLRSSIPPLITRFKTQLRRKFKDDLIFGYLDEIIDSAEGLPIGNYLSQFLANYYLTPFDHWIKEAMQVKYYFRYADDIVILSDSKQHLHELLAEIRIYLSDRLKLIVKDNYQVFPVHARGIDFVGYKFYHTHTLLRKSIKQRFARMVAKAPRDAIHCILLRLGETLQQQKFTQQINKSKTRIMEILVRHTITLDPAVIELLKGFSGGQQVPVKEMTSSPEIKGSKSSKAHS
jgi:hypothetical protein